MKRKILKKSKDSRVFRNTADKTKVINITKPVVMRGGFRL